MASTDLILGLYSAAGLLELSGIAMTAIDLQAKAKTLKAGPDEPEDGVYNLDSIFTAALGGPWLKIAAALLAAGIIVGTVANALSALHH